MNIDNQSYEDGEVVLDLHMSFRFQPGGIDEVFTGNVRYNSHSGFIADFIPLKCFESAVNNRPEYKVCATMRILYMISELYHIFRYFGQS